MVRRVLWVVKGLGPGGAERLLATHAAKHDSDHFAVTCAYVLPWKDHLAEEFEQQGVATTCVSTRRRDVFWPVRLTRLVRSGDWDVVHVHSPLPGSVARLAARTVPRARRPFVVSTEHNTWASHRRATRLFNRVTSRWNDHCFAVTAEARASMPSRRQAHTVVLRHGIDVGAVSGLRAERELVRSEFGIAPDTILIGTVANFRPQKDYPNLLQAMRLLADRGLAVHLLAVGQGPDADGVAELVDELGLGDLVTLAGYRSDAPRVMAAADIFTLASRWEGLPVAVMEATALGLAVVATNVGGLSEHFTSGVDAILVPPADAAALADALQSVAIDTGLRRKLGAASAARAADFDAARSVASVEAVYRSASHDRPNGSGEVRPESATTKPANSPARRPSGLDIRPATPDDRAAVIELCRIALGWGDDSRFEQLFAWKHDDNAFGPSYQWVAVDGDVVVGVRIFMRWEFVRDGKVIRAVRAVDTAVHPDYQGRGLFTSLTTHGLDEVHADGIDFVFNTPNAQSLPGYLKMGWGVVGRLPTSIRPNGLSGLTTAARSRVAAGHWPDLSRPVGSAVDSSSLWQPDSATTPSRQLSTRMSEEFLTWRYGLAMLGYRTLDVESGRMIVRSRQRGRSRELVVLDHQGVTNAEADRALDAAATATGASHALGIGALPGSRWIPAPRSGPTLTWRGVRSASQPHQSNWSFVMGDIELF